MRLHSRRRIDAVLRISSMSYDSKITGRRIRTEQAKVPFATLVHTSMRRRVLHVPRVALG
jgi:hypothetical protein